MAIEDSSILERMILSLAKHGEFLELFNYNIKTINEAKEYLFKYKKVSINNATGLGKTIAVKEIIKSYDFKTILYIAPSDEILKQSRKSLGEKFNIEYKTFAKLHRKIGKVAPVGRRGE